MLLMHVMCPNPQVIIPLAVTVGQLKGQLQAANLAAATRGPLLSAGTAGDAFATTEECRNVIPKGERVL